MLNLTGKKALVTGIANNRSIAWGIAQQLHAAGADLGVTFLPDERGRFEKKVRDLAAPLDPDFFVPCDVQNEEQIDSMFETAQKTWGKLDILIHCLAFADKEGLIGDFSSVTREAFSKSLDISTYSLARLAKGAKPLMSEGGSIVTLSYLGGVKVIPNYNLMGIAKAGLEMSVRYLASEMGLSGNSSQCYFRWPDPNLGFFCRRGNFGDDQACGRNSAFASDGYATRGGQYGSFSL